MIRNNILVCVLLFVAFATCVFGDRNDGGNGDPTRGFRKACAKKAELYRRNIDEIETMIQVLPSNFIASNAALMERSRQLLISYKKEEDKLSIIAAGNWHKVEVIELADMLSVDSNHQKFKDDFATLTSLFKKKRAK